MPPMKAEQIELYYTIHRLLDQGLITEERGQAVCLNLLREIMEENSDVFVSLKERD